MSHSDHPDRHTTIDVTPLGTADDEAFVAVVEPRGSRLVRMARGVELSVGRSRSSGVFLDDDAVSRLHATLRWDGGDVVTVSDCDSRNGTQIEGRALRGSRDVSSGARIQIGGAVLSPVLPGRADPMPDEESPDVGLVAHDRSMHDLLAAVRRVAVTSLPVLIVGETGVGKDLVARYLHACSPRRAGPFVALNCGAVPDSVAESSLFGHERGSFTGAERQHRGVFESATGGTLLLDEVGELTPSSQARLLRTLESGHIRRVGGTDEIDVDVRVIAATHRDLGAAVRAGTFREDLLYRLDVLRVDVPPLRERPDDIVPLARHFLAALFGDRSRDLDASGCERLRSLPWRGNVRELRNAIARAAALGGPTLTAADFDLGEPAPRRPGGSLDGMVSDAERAAIVEALAACGNNQTRAARRLGITRRALIYRMEKHGLKPSPEPRQGERGEK